MAERWGPLHIAVEMLTYSKVVWLGLALGTHQLLLIPTHPVLAVLPVILWRPLCRGSNDYIHCILTSWN